MSIHSRPNQDVNHFVREERERKKREKIDPDLVGRRLAGRQQSIAWRQTMNYAAAVADDNPRYLDDTNDEGLIAPPLFAVTLTWPIALDISHQLEDAILPELIVRMVHIYEHLIFHRPVVPGDRITIGGTVAAVRPLENGTIVYLRLEAVDHRERPVFTEYTGALFRSVGCLGEARGLENIPALDSPALAAEPLWDAVIPIPRYAAHLYDAGSGIVFPIHTSVATAHAMGLPDILLQGTATLAYAARELVNRQAGGDPARLREIACRFSGMVIPGSEIHVRLMGQRSAENGSVAAFAVLDEKQAPVLSQGFVRFTK